MFRNHIRAITLIVFVVVLFVTAMVVAAGPATSTGCC